MKTTLKPQIEKKVLHIGQNNPAAYFENCSKILQQQGSLRIAALVSAIPTCIRLAYMLEGAGYVRKELDIQMPSFPDKTNKDKMFQLPEIEMTYEVKSKCSSK